MASARYSVRRMINSRVFALCPVIVGALSLIPSIPLRADVVTFQPIADTTLFEVAPSNNLGGAEFFNAGTAGNGFRNRALLLFDIDDIIPAGAIITEASLTLDIVRQPRDNPAITFFDLHRVLQPWGEGAQVPEVLESPGLGAPALPGEATWNFQFTSGTPWSIPGGQAGVDFSTAVSGSALVQTLGETVLFESTPALVANVQGWLDQPNGNYGWVLLTQDEAIERSARSFASRESGFGPTLTISFTVVPEPSAVALAIVGISLFCGSSIFRRRQ